MGSDTADAVLTRSEGSRRPDGPRHDRTWRISMKIGILGVGSIGATLTQRLSKSGHEVQVANSRGPETIPSEVFAAGGRAVQAADVVTGVEALIVSIPL